MNNNEGKIGPLELDIVYADHSKDGPGTSTLTLISQDEAQRTHQIFQDWAEAFSQSEAFEAFFPSRIDELLDQAYHLENYLKKQKELIIERMNRLSQTLKIKL
ncbi:uncharacterized protein LOC116614542 isoform X2 [Nematostella vectensis]|uniref:uncharacterized protein LOC116614542 isoform X2 n=1 Tax=Nematostella vectensis TaxID=45351 RepID=UPI0020778B31|nr:uncharacterized protein LOC116614542 isoform X2 [Nematostella vectensis]